MLMSNIIVVNKPARESLTDRQLTDYEAYKKPFVKWLSAVGKDEKHNKDYAHETTRQTSQRVDRFYRWLWNDMANGYTTSVTTEDATEHMEHLVFSENEQDGLRSPTGQKEGRETAGTATATGTIKFQVGIGYR